MVKKDTLLNKTAIMAKYGFNREWINKLGDPDKIRLVRHGEAHLFNEERVLQLIADNQAAYDDLVKQNGEIAEKRAKRAAAKSEALENLGINPHSKHSPNSLQLARKLEQEIRRLFPKIPEKAAKEAAIHATEPYSNRVGRSFLSECNDISFEEAAYRAVCACARHKYTKYDSIRRELGNDADATELARDTIKSDVDRVLKRWGYSK